MRRSNNDSPNKSWTLRGSVFVSLVAVGLLCGCEPYRARRDSITMGLGNSVAHNIAVQTIDPWPPKSRDPRINVNGQRLLTGVQRYETNRSIQPRNLSTQSISTGSGGSGGAGGGGGGGF